MHGVATLWTNLYREGTVNKFGFISAQEIIATIEGLEVLFSEPIANT